MVKSIFKLSLVFRTGIFDFISVYKRESYGNPTVYDDPIFFEQSFFFLLFPSKRPTIFCRNCLYVQHARSKTLDGTIHRLFRNWIRLLTFKNPIYNYRILHNTCSARACTVTCVDCCKKRKFFKIYLDDFSEEVGCSRLIPQCRCVNGNWSCYVISFSRS